VTDVQRLLEVLADAGAEFVVIGGVAMVLRGSSRVTIDIDVCYARNDANLARLAHALAFEAVARGATSLEIGRVQARVLDLDALERSKRAAGRAKDLLDLAEIAEIRRRSKP
jgi:hypothetical protein